MILLEAGHEPAMLEYYSRIMERNGFSGDLLFKDMVSILHSANDFHEELHYLATDILFGDEFRYRLREKNVGEDLTQRTLDDLSSVVRYNCLDMYRTLVTSGLYDKEGKFPNEYIKYKSGTFFIRRG